MPLGSCANISIYAQSGNTCQDGMPDSLVCCAQNCPTIGQAVITPGGPTVFCSGQSVSLTSTQQSYLWSTGQTSQSITVSNSNTYSITPTDPTGCIDTASITVTVTPGPTVTIVPASSLDLCAGDSVTLDAQAGFATYLWNTGETTQTISANLSQSYSVTVSDAIGCLGSNAITVNVAPPITSSVVSTDLTCNGMMTPDGQATVTPAGGYGSYTYSWSTGQTGASATGLSTGTSYVSISDINGCTG